MKQVTYLEKYLTCITNLNHQLRQVSSLVQAYNVTDVGIPSEYFHICITFVSNDHDNPEYWKHCKGDPEHHKYPEWCDSVLICIWLLWDRLSQCTHLIWHKRVRASPDGCSSGTASGGICAFDKAGCRYCQDIVLRNKCGSLFPNHFFF